MCGIWAEKIRKEKEKMPFRASGSEVYVDVELLLKLPVPVPYRYLSDARDVRDLLLGPSLACKRACDVHCRRANARGAPSGY